MLANNRDLDIQFQTVIPVITSIPKTKLIYHHNNLSSVANGGGCLYYVYYIFSTELDESDFRAALQDKKKLYYFTSWIDRDKFNQKIKTDKYAFNDQEIEVMENIFNSNKNVVRFKQVGNKNFGFLRNGLDPRCGNFD
ncbi:MAG: hypothetical protein QNJ63_31455 [Calothrix sp. MO_192.B10]|nr:hypothetical protein [Calothrix sp. MO_192.B10]